ncbi:MAG: hypothetical protein IKT65_04235 [Clostridia bacterium]|nr:hypothetical protein [Clostridia bacterium]
MAKKFADACYESKGHWGYVGRDTNVYISVGCYYYEGTYYSDICTSDTDIYG